MFFLYQCVCAVGWCSHMQISARTAAFSNNTWAQINRWSLLWRHKLNSVNYKNNWLRLPADFLCSRAVPQHCCFPHYTHTHSLVFVHTHAHTHRAISRGVFPPSCFCARVYFGHVPDPYCTGRGSLILGVCVCVCRMGNFTGEFLFLWWYKQSHIWNKCCTGPTVNIKANSSALPLCHWCCNPQRYTKKEPKQGLWVADSWE